MRILLATQTPPLPRTTNRVLSPFPPGTSQSYWYRALRQLNHQVKFYIYTDNPIVPKRWIYAINSFLVKYNPRFFNRYRRLLNRFYLYNPLNYLRSIILIWNTFTFKPEVILFSGGISELTSWPLRIAKYMKITTYLLDGDHPEQYATNFEKQNCQLFDHIVTNDPEHNKAWIKFGANQAITTPESGFDPHIYKSLVLTNKQKQKYSTDVVFVGTLFSDRQQILKQLTEFNLSIYGHLPSGVKLDHYLKPFYKGLAYDKKINTIYNASKIALNFVPQHMPNGGNMRTFEIPGSGSFQIINRCPNEWFKNGKEIIIYKDIIDLKKKIHYYIKNPDVRNRIANAGLKRALKEHTYKSRFQKILAL